MRIILGLLKGLVLGGAVGFGALKAGLPGNFGFVVCGAAAALAGLLCGRPPWRHDTVVTPILKTIFGFGVGAGLYYGWSALGLGAKVAALGGPSEIAAIAAPAVIAVLYGTFVEIDDGASAAKKAAASE
jgi:hypothetical protein